MRRREVIAGLGALGVFGAGAAAVYTGFDLRGDGRIDPVELQRLDAPGTERVPDEGRVTYVSLFATWCGTCERKMTPLGEAATAVDDVQFLSVTNEPVGRTIEVEDVVDWWVAHDGRWPVAHDADLELTRRIDAPGVPYSAVFDADNRLAWAEGGYKGADEILGAIDATR